MKGFDTDNALHIYFVVVIEADMRKILVFRLNIEIIYKFEYEITRLSDFDKNKIYNKYYIIIVLSILRAGKTLLDMLN